MHGRKIVAALSVSALLLTGGCGGNDDTADESQGSPAVSAEPAQASSSAEPSAEPSESATAAASALGETITITLVKGKPTKALDDVKLSKDDKLTIKATSDEAHEIHVHGYDKRLDLKPGQVDGMTFTADKAGSFEVEVEGTHTALFNIVVK